MTFILMMSKPYPDDDAGRIDYTDYPVLAFTREDQATQFCKNCNDHVAALIQREKIDHEMRASYEHAPPFEFVVATVGPKPVFNQVLKQDTQYNISHKEAVAAWRQKFSDWKSANPELWATQVEEWVIESRGDLPIIPNRDLFPFLCDLESMIIDDNWGANIGPKFVIETVQNFPDTVHDTQAKLHNH